MIFIGIDPGLSGGIAFINDLGSLVFPTPVIGGKEYDIGEMKKILVNYGMLDIRAPLFAMIENQISMPGQGLTSTLQTGKGFGIWLGLLAGLGIPYQVVAAVQWQRKLFTGVKGNLDTKQKSEVIAKRLFPGVDFRKSERSRVAHDGLTDAILIAEYGRRIHSGSGATKVSGVSHVSSESNPDVCINCGAYIPTSDPNDCAQGSLLSVK